MTELGQLGDPHTGDADAPVEWVERLPAQAGFVIHLTRKTDTPTPFTYFIVE